MKVPFYLVVSSSGSLRVNKSQPKLNWDEVSIGMTLNIPDEIFSRPALQAEITIPSSAIPASPLNAEVADNIKEVIKEVTGLNFVIGIIEPEENTIS